MSRARLPGVVAMVAVVVGVAMPVRAQEVLVAIGGPETNPIGQALRDLGIDFESGLGAEDFLAKLRDQQWDLVVVHTLNRFEFDFEADILAELEAHVARGGALHFQMADLENVPEAWYDLLGLEGGVDLELPLENIFVPTPSHPIWNSAGVGGVFPLGDERYPPDYGDSLVPGTSTYAVGSFGVDGAPAIAIARDGLVVVNGQQWDNWQSGEGVAANQIWWLLSCHADLDGDGELTVFDFLEFQNLFNLRDVRADVFYDGRFDVFDFLEFFNQFQAGCP